MKDGLATIAPLLEPEHLELAERLERSLPGTIGVLPPAGDDGEARSQARRILEILGEEGWARYALPGDEDGAGPGADLRGRCLIRERLAAVSPLADAVFALQCLGSTPIALAGRRRVREEWLPAVAAGRAMTAFAMTEAAAGSDVASMTTRARRDGAEWVLDGRKHLISNAGIADVYAVFAVTDPAAGRRGLSCFAVPAHTPGLEFEAAQVLSEPHPLGEIAFRECRVSEDFLLGEPGEGFHLGMRTLDALRATVAAAACGMAARALQEATAHAREREQFGRPLVRFQLVQAKLASMATELAAARLLTYRAAWEVDLRGEEVTLRSAMAKWKATEAAQQVVDEAVQVVGGRGVLADHPVDRLYRAVRALRIYEGTSEIQQLVIARRLLA